jgi:hypothetical protein
MRIWQPPPTISRNWRIVVMMSCRGQSVPAITSLLQVSDDYVRDGMRAGRVSRRTTTTWNSSTDPCFVTTMRRVLELYDHSPVGWSASMSSDR